MITNAEIFLAKAEESLFGAQSEFEQKRYNNCANRCYYACFQAAIAVLIMCGFKPRKNQWSHTFVQGTFVGDLINRRKLLPADIRDTLKMNQELREVADYQEKNITEVKAKRAMQRTKRFIELIKERK